MNLIKPRVEYHPFFGKITLECGDSPSIAFWSADEVRLRNGEICGTTIEAVEPFELPTDKQVQFFMEFDEDFVHLRKRVLEKHREELEESIEHELSEDDLTLHGLEIPRLEAEGEEWGFYLQQPFDENHLIYVTMRGSAIECVNLDG